ncbi:hypothetical protein AVL62_00450 [Serinicoccus chungangensis]|uniref:GTPase n=1 Tax=Serinicoccus chungangensis TaxID=767452 RepID=A0A0W8I560_9MICO|nr:hypothetical protein [Serinicoccus chungangensis]KUG53318.1 hypothetical protein AVL62_00450 [Serinicoccus chungangensis]
MSQRAAPVVIGVYDADGGVLGEAAYLWGKVRGTAHCSLCDITHSPVRRKKEWDALVARLDATVELRHRNELTAAQSAAALQAGLPVVLVADLERQGYDVLLDADDLEGTGGDVTAFGDLLRERLAAR